MRLIDGDALFDRVYDGYGLSLDEGPANMFMGWINEAPTIEIDSRWVPVAERLPDSFQPVIVFREKGKGEFVTEQGCKDIGDWWKVYGTRTKKVIYWMPLPEPPEEVSK